MAGESQQIPDSAPDPTVLVTEAIERSARTQKELRHSEIETVTARLDAMDEATKVLKETVNRMPTDVQQAVGQLKEVMGVELTSIDRRFGDSSVAVAAALAAQEKLSIQQNLSNQTAVQKSENATNELIRQNADAARQAQSAQSDQIADIKERLTRLEATKLGATEQRQETRQISGAMQGTIGFILGLIITGITILGIVVANKP